MTTFMKVKRVIQVNKERVRKEKIDEYKKSDYITRPFYNCLQTNRVKPTLISLITRNSFCYFAMMEIQTMNCINCHMATFREKTFYNYLCPSICQVQGETFSVPRADRVLNLSMHIPLIYEHLFYKYFVRQSVGQATKAKELRYLWMLSSLLFLIAYNYLKTEAGSTVCGRILYNRPNGYYNLL